MLGGLDGVLGYYLSLGNKSFAFAHTLTKLHFKILASLSLMANVGVYCNADTKHPLVAFQICIKPPSKSRYPIVTNRGVVGFFKGQKVSD